jgi:uncharacterized protein YkwD
MRDIFLRYYKVILAQVGAYMFTWYLVTYVFLGPLPVVSPSFKKNVAKSPEIISAGFVEFASSVKERVLDLKPDVVPEEDGYVPEPWVMVIPTPMGGVPTSTPYPTSAPTALPTPTPQPEAPQQQRRSQPTQQPTPVPTRRPTKAPPRMPDVPTAPPTPTPTPVVPAEQKEQGTLEEINKRRQEAGAPPVSLQWALVDAAHAHGAWMGAGTGYSRCGHGGDGGSNPFQRAAAAGYRGDVGEIVSCNWPTPKQAVQAWMDSPGHKAIMLDPQRTDIGIGWGGNMAVAVLGR